MSHDADHIRGFALHVANVDTLEPRTEKVELCPGARVYSYTLCGGFEQTDPPSPAPEPPELVAVLRLQDSEIELWSDCCTIRADLPGLAWPSFARLIIAPSGIVTLNITYGHCS